MPGIWDQIFELVEAGVLQSTILTGDPDSFELVFALGVDPGLSRCGYGAVRNHAGALRAEAMGHLSTPPDMPLSERLAVLWNDIEGLIAELKPDVMVVERVLFQVNARTAMSVGQASGLALAAAARAGCPVVQYSPNEVKLAVTGYGSATKEQVQEMVRILLDLPEVPRPADRADALALAVCHLSGAGLRARIPTTKDTGNTMGASV